MIKEDTLALKLHCAAMRGKRISMLYLLLNFSHNLAPFECFLVLQNGHQFQAILFSGGGGGETCKYFY